jgi:hypothetical protein
MVCPLHVPPRCLWLVIASCVCRTWVQRTCYRLYCTYTTYFTLFIADFKAALDTVLVKMCWSICMYGCCCSCSYTAANAVLCIELSDWQVMHAALVGTQLRGPFDVPFVLLVRSIVELSKDRSLCVCHTFLGFAPHQPYAAVTAGAVLHVTAHHSTSQHARHAGSTACSSVVALHAPEVCCWPVL